MTTDGDRSGRINLDAYRHRSRSGPCFICAFLAGDPESRHNTVYEDARHIAFLDRYPTVPGKVLVAPRAHVQHVVRDLDEPRYLDLMRVVRNVALAVEAVVPSERTYLLSLGSQQATTTCTGTSPRSPRTHRTSDSSTTRS